MAVSNCPGFTSTPIIVTTQIGTASAWPDTNANNNSAWAWGYDASGRVGDAATANKSSPVSILGNHTFTAIAVGGNSNASLKSDGTCWTWGGNSSGFLADNTTNDRSSPVSVVGAHSFIYITGAYQGGRALKADGTAWGWGVNTTAGEVGDSSTTNRSSPVSIVGAHSFYKISGGYFHGVGVKIADGTAWSWGNAGNGELADGQTAANRSSPVSAQGAHSFVQVSCGGTHTLALKADGTLWAWGSPTNGQLGDGQTAAKRSSPNSVIGAHSFIYIAAQGDSSVALKADGSAWAWGLGSAGQLGNNATTAKISSPVSVVGGHSFIQLLSVASVTLGLKPDRSLWAWGNQAFGTAGDNTTFDRSSPVSVLGNIPVLSLATSGLGYTAIITRNDFTNRSTVFTAGANGSRVDQILIAANGTTSVGVVRFYISTASSTFLFKEVAVSGVTPSTTIPAFTTTVPFALDISAGTSILVATNISQAFSITATGGNY